MLRYIYCLPHKQRSLSRTFWSRPLDRLDSCQDDGREKAFEKKSFDVYIVSVRAFLERPHSVPYVLYRRVLPQFQDLIVITILQRIQRGLFGPLAVMLLSGVVVFFIRAAINRGRFSVTYSQDDGEGYPNCCC